jgi:putative peptidoglycan lipid II flippase
MPQVSSPPSGARWIAAGILCSRLAGFLRDRVLAHYFGLGAYADVFRVALRGPNMLQNLLGEGTLSASFIPVYARLREEGRASEARAFAGAAFGLLAVLVAAIVVAGVLLAAPLVATLAPGFLEDGGAGVDRYGLTVRAVRWMFPMTGLLVLAAWTLAVLNSHRRFLLPYVAPVLWNAAIATAVVWVAHRSGAREPADLVIAGCVGALVGALLQFAVQLPLAARLVGGLRPALAPSTIGLREALGTFGPALLARGAVQLSAYLDLLLASFLAAGAIAALGVASSLYFLPISVFAMSVSAAELPELAAATTGLEGEDPWKEFRRRVAAGLTQTAFLTIPSAVVFWTFGSWIVATLYETGAFGPAETRLTYCVLAAYAGGLVASGASRLLQNAFYAAGEARRPARVAILRMTVSAGLGLPAMLMLDRYAVGGSGLRFGAVGLSLASAVASWTELVLLSRALRRTVHRFALPWRRWGQIWLLALGCAAAAAALGWSMRSGGVSRPASLAASLALFGLAYAAAASRLGFEEGKSWLGRFGRLPSGWKRPGLGRLSRLGRRQDRP